MDKRYGHLYQKGDRNKRRQSRRKKPAQGSRQSAFSGSATGKTKRIVLTGKQRMLAGLACGTLFIFVLVMIIGSFTYLVRKRLKRDNSETTTEQEVIQVPDLVGVADRFPDLPITEDFISINEYSRPGLALSSNPQYIVIHYTANPGSSAKQNRDYFDNLQNTHITYASAQFVIGLEGEIIQCVPCNEIAYCSNSLNDQCISIEMCHPDDTGNFNDATYNSCVYLVAHLMNYYHMDMDHLIRHYDVTGKNCPKYFVDNPERWQVFKDFVKKYRDKYKEENIEEDYKAIKE